MRYCLRCIYGVCGMSLIAICAVSLFHGVSFAYRFHSSSRVATCQHAGVIKTFGINILDRSLEVDCEQGRTLVKLEEPLVIYPGWLPWHLRAQSAASTPISNIGTVDDYADDYAIFSDKRRLLPRSVIGFDIGFDIVKEPQFSMYIFAGNRTFGLISYPCWLEYEKSYEISMPAWFMALTGSALLVLMMRHRLRLHRGFEVLATDQGADKGYRVP